MFLKPNAIIYVRRSGLIVAGKHVAPARLNFPTDVVDNIEVLKPEKFTAACKQFFNDHKLNGKRVLIVLDQTIVFTKLVDLNESDVPEQLLQDFISAMPFAPNKRACVAVESGQQLQLYATNAELYQAVAKALRLSSSAKLLAITPAAAYAPTDSKQLSAAIEKFVADTKTRQDVNFADVTPS